MMPSLLGGLPNPLFRRWQRQMERQRTKPIPGVGVAVVSWDETEHGLVRADRLLLVTLDSLEENGQTVLRLCGYRGRRVPFGFRFGGEGDPVFTADLNALPGSLPTAGLDRYSSQATLLAGLKLQDRLLRRRSQPPCGFRMPPLWAGFGSAASWGKKGIFILSDLSSRIDQSINAAAAGRVQSGFGGTLG